MDKIVLVFGVAGVGASLFFLQDASSMRNKIIVSVGGALSVALVSASMASIVKESQKQKSILLDL